MKTLFETLFNTTVLEPVHLRNCLLWFPVLALCTLTACGPAKSALTQDMVNQYKWSESDLKRVQFYVSKDVVLRRDLVGGKTQIRGGRVMVEEGRQVEEVVIRRGTPGVLAVMPKSDRLGISFEGRDGFLMFGPSREWGGRYMLLASSWEQNWGEVTYRGTKYYTSSNSATAYLRIAMNKISKVSSSRRTVKGRRL